MTDKELIKALECCWVKGLCNGCPLDNDAGGTPCRQLGNKVLDLINRQQAEHDELKNNYRETLTKQVELCDVIEKQQAEIEAWKKINQRLYDEMEERRKEDIGIAKGYARIEAIKEFAERLKKEKYSVCAGHGMSECVVSVYDINNLVKEMVGEQG